MAHITPSSMYETLAEAASAPETQQRIYTFAKTHNLPALLCALCRNPHLTGHIDGLLATERSARVRNAWLRHPGRTPADVRSVFGQRAATSTRTAIAELPGLDDDIYRALSKDDSIRTACALLLNGDVSNDIAAVAARTYGKHFEAGKTSTGARPPYEVLADRPPSVHLAAWQASAGELDSWFLAKYQLNAEQLRPLRPSRYKDIPSLQVKTSLMASLMNALHGQAALGNDDYLALLQEVRDVCTEKELTILGIGRASWSDVKSRDRVTHPDGPYIGRTLGNFANVTEAPVSDKEVAAAVRENDAESARVLLGRAGITREHLRALLPVADCSDARTRSMLTITLATSNDPKVAAQAFIGSGSGCSSINFCVNPRETLNEVVVLQLAAGGRVPSSIAHVRDADPELAGHLTMADVLLGGRRDFQEHVAAMMADTLRRPADWDSFEGLREFTGTVRELLDTAAAIAS